MSDDSDLIEFPCSKDFEFYMNIAHTVPSHSPANRTFSTFSDKEDGPTPPVSPIPVSFDSVDWIEKQDEPGIRICQDDCKHEEEGPSSQMTQGVYLEATQVPLVTQMPVLLSQGVVEKK